MKSFPNKYNVKSAVKAKQKFNLSGDHYTTSDFFKFQPIFSREMVPGDKFVISSLETFTRLVPLAVPTFGRCSIHNRAFFVPFTKVMRGFNEFITQVPYKLPGNSAFIINKVPYLKNDELCSFICISLMGVGSESEYDIKYDDNYYRHTLISKRFLDLLYSLGYNLVFLPSVKKEMSALPLLCAIRVYLDYYVPKKYRNSFEILGYFNENPTTNGFRVSQEEILNEIVNILNVFYDPDYFNSSWDTPTGDYYEPYSSYPSINFNDGIQGTNNAQPRIKTDASVPNPIIVSANTSGIFSSSYVNNLTETALQKLRALYNFVTRNGFSGNSSVNRFLSKFGVLPHDPDKCIYIGGETIPVQISDVVSTADTAGTPGGLILGAQAGKGVGYGNSKFSYETKEHGMFIVISTIIPHTGYYQGLSREHTHLTPLDFYQPEFDNIGTRAISNSELMFDQTSDFNNGNYDGIFGFTPQYSEYKTGHISDRVSGDFRVRSFSEGLNSYHFMREFLATDEFTADMEKNFNFMRGSNQYDRVFTIPGTIQDHFYIVHHIECEAYRNMSSITDSIDIDGYKDLQFSPNQVDLN